MVVKCGRLYAERAMKVVGDVAPFKLESPILFRDERVEKTFDEENPPAHSRVLDAHTREIEAGDVIELMGKIYGYDLSWRPFEFVPEWKR